MSRYRPRTNIPTRLELPDTCGQTWPRGVKCEAAELREWIEEVATSSSLRKWFNYDPKKWSAFEWRYFEELKGNTAVAELNKRLKEHRKLTLSYAATDEEHNHAIALKKFFERS